LSLSLEDGGVAKVEHFPAVGAGECIEESGWPPEILRDGEASWALGKDHTILIEGDGWIAQLSYGSGHLSPDFTDLYYPTCAGGPGKDYFILRNY